MSLRQWDKKKKKTVGNEISFRHSGGYHKFSKTKINARSYRRDAAAAKLNQIMEVYWLLRSIHELSAAQIRDVVCTDAAVAIIRGEGEDRVERVVWIAGTQVDVDDTAQWSMQVTLETIRYTWIVDSIFLH